MQYAIIISEQDPAGLNIKECLLELYDWKETDTYENHPVYEYKNAKLYSIEEKSIHAENLDKNIEADFFIFASKHQSKEGTQSLTCHTPGNWNKADYGGQENKLCIASSLKLKQTYLALKDNDIPTNITLECTHHGPLLTTPCMFIEIGSNETHWKDRISGEIIANTIIKLLDETIQNNQTAIGLGGPHYCNNFNKILERTDIALSHICPKHHLENLNEKTLTEAINKTKEKVDFILLDWKGLGPFKEKVKTILKNLNIEYKRTDQL